MTLNSFSYEQYRYKPDNTYIHTHTYFIAHTEIKGLFYPDLQLLNQLTSPLAFIIVYTRNVLREPTAHAQFVNYPRVVIK